MWVCFCNSFSLIKWWQTCAYNIILYIPWWLRNSWCSLCYWSNAWPSTLVTSVLAAMEVDAKLLILEVLASVLELLSASTAKRRLSNYLKVNSISTWAITSNTSSFCPTSPTSINLPSRLACFGMLRMRRHWFLSLLIRTMAVFLTSLRTLVLQRLS